MLFAQTQRPHIIAANPELASKVAEVGKEVGRLWGLLSEAEKDKFKQQSASDKAAHEAKYGKTVREPKASKGAAKEGKSKKVKDANAPKRPTSPYINFCNANREKILAANPELRSKVTEVAKLLGQQWKGLSDTEKAKYQN